MAVQGMFVHGNAFTPPEPPGPNSVQNVTLTSWTDIVGSHRGEGVYWEGIKGATPWFHVAIPSPVWRDGVRAKVKTAFVLFQSGAAEITKTEVWDGANRLADFTWAISGDHRRSFGPDNSFPLPNEPEVFFGVGISVQVHFSQAGPAGWIMFAGAGADFVV